MSAQMQNLGDKMRSRRRNGGGGEIWSDEPTILGGLCISWSGDNLATSARSIVRIT